MSVKQNTVHVLHEGYCRTDPSDTSAMRANCTCTLIRTAGGRNIIVDTMTPWDGQRIIDALQQHNLQPSDINAVICTHGHSDHIGCNNLFTNAEWHIVGKCYHKGDKFMEWNFLEKNLPVCGADDVYVLGTPGHTLTCVSVIVGNTNLGRNVGICGDLFEREEDIDDSKIWIDAGSEDEIKQRKYRLLMAERCSYIVPGHGPGFEMTEAKLKKLRQDAQENPKT